MLLQEEHGVRRYKVESEGVVIEESANEMATDLLTLACNPLLPIGFYIIYI